MNRRKAFYLLCIAVLLLFSVFPDRALSGAQNGLQSFISSVLPALLPFYVGTTILIQSGVARRLTRPFSFLMKPLFDLPGESAFAFLMAAISGYPLGARLTTQLYEGGLLSSSQASRTAILSACCGPSFMLGAVSSGMLHCPQAGVIIAVSHYLAMVTVAICSRPFFGPSDQRSLCGKAYTKASKRASLDSLTLDTIASSAVSLWSVGSYMIFFSALIAVLSTLGIFTILNRILAPAFTVIGIPNQAAPAILKGMIEMTDGCASAASLPISMESKIICCSFLVSFGGCSVLGQCHYYLRKTGMRFSALLLAKSSAGIISLLYSSILLRIISVPVETSAPVLRFEQILGGNAALLIIGALVLSLLGTAISLYTMRNQQ